MKISLIIASRWRPDHLKRLLSALRFQLDVSFEVIVVSDLGKSAVQALVPADRATRWVQCAEANLAKARNLGVAASGGDVVAFCDDDAVPEPNWLRRLTRGFEDGDVHSACGFTRGRNGVSYQWKAMTVDGYGNDHPLETTDRALRSEIVKTVGTNMAFRKSALQEIGGFDEAYRFFLEDADVNMRMAQLGGLTAIEPRAEVHHAFAPSAQRLFNRVPKSLFEIGASKAYFCRQHGAPELIAEELDGFREAQSKRLHRFFNAGLLPGNAVASLLNSLDAGFAEGAQRLGKTGVTASGQAFEEYQPVRAGSERHVLSCGLFGAGAKKRKAAELAAQGAEVTLVQFIYSPRRLSVQFTDQGYWLHQGGVFGQGMRDDPHFRFSTRRRRIEREKDRLMQIRTDRTK